MNTNALLKEALLKILQPLARILIRHGVGVKEVYDVLKLAYVKAADNEEFSLSGKEKLSTSRMAVLTGLNRTEVQRLRDANSLDESLTNSESSAWRRNRAASVISGWVNDVGYLDKSGEPVDLAIDGDEKSFASLVKQYSGGMPLPAVLSELLRVKAVEKIGKSKMRLLKKSYIPFKSNADYIDMFGEQTRDFLNAIDKNFLGANYLQLACKREIDAKQINEFRRWSAAEVLELLNQCDSWQSDSSIKGSGSGGASSTEKEERATVGIGVYYFQN